MKKVFSWESFPTEFLKAVILSNKTPEKYRSNLRSESKLMLSARMSRIARKPSLSFVSRYRREIEQYILCDMERVNRICTFLQSKNMAGICTNSGEQMRNSLFTLKMNPTLQALYLDELNQTGMEVDDSKEKLYYSSPKLIDLSCVIPNDISLEDFQHEAVESMVQFYNVNSRGILMMPTGSGKTRTSVYFLLRYIISQGYQVLWLAHRSLLLEQTASTFIRNASLLKLSDAERDRMNLICVSGEHCFISMADKSFDVIIGSVQSLSSKTDVFPFFLRKKVMVVVDEAHHTTAPTYRKIIDTVFDTVPDAKLLGLTATPVRLSDKESVQLMKYYDDKIIYNVSLGKLLADHVLAYPNWEHIPTNFDIETHIDIDEEKYIQKWGELSPKLVDFLARVCERNELIADTYVNNRERYGKTIIFAMNAYHCISLCDLLTEKGVRCDYVYSGEKSNDHTIQKFKNGELDVLININILTEGSDIPDVQTVFITRPTQSDVLLMQMVGRGMRGVGFGGTETVNVIDFCDKWESFTKWLNPEFVFGEALPFDEYSYKRYEKRKYPWQMFKDIIDGLSYTYGECDEKLMVSLPVGWYDVHVSDKQINVIVFENQKNGYQNIMQDYRKLMNCKCNPADVIKEYFASFCLVPSEHDICLVLSEIDRKGAPLVFHRFDERNEVDAVVLAGEMKSAKMIPSVIERKINDTYDSHPDMIDSIYGGKEQFREKIYDCMINGDSVSFIGVPVKEIIEESLPFDCTPHYDINELYEEVIQEMFKGKDMRQFHVSKADRPEICWTDKYYSSFFGVFMPESNLIEINRCLNSASVSKETVKFIIYHELLHTAIFKHNKEFRSFEHRYPDFAEHDHFLDSTFRKFNIFSDASDVR